MNLHDVIIQPVITEKSEMQKNLQPNQSTYTFKVHKKANKELIRQALYHIYRVDARSIRTLNVPSRQQRFRMTYARVPGWKKAIVTLAAGQTIDLTKGEV
jgi:large subunit ribosomal protein L23